MFEIVLKRQSKTSRGRILTQGMTTSSVYDCEV